MSKAEAYNSTILDEIFNSINPEEEDKIRKRMLLAARIDKGIKAKGWKKKDLALALNKHHSEIIKWLSGTHSFNSDTLFDIERVLNICLVKLDEAPKEQVVKFNEIVCKEVVTTTNPAYPSFLNNSLINLYQNINQTYRKISINN